MPEYFGIALPEGVQSIKQLIGRITDDIAKAEAVEAELDERIARLNHERGILESIIRFGLVSEE